MKFNVEDETPLQFDYANDQSLFDETVIKIKEFWRLFELKAHRMVEKLKLRRLLHLDYE